MKTDAICTCNEGQHCVDDNCDSCAQHSSCPPGFGVKQTGEWPVWGPALEAGERSRGPKARGWAVGALER